MIECPQIAAHLHAGPRPAANARPTRRGAAVLLVTSLVTLLGACGGGDIAATAAAGGSVGTAMAKVSIEAAGAHCTHGGTRIETGIDADHNGTLDAGEVSAVQYACNGAPGSDGANGINGTNGSNGTPGATSLVRIESEAAGANCAHGGSKISVGLDTDTSGVLDDAEVTSTSYVCSGAGGTNGINGTNGTNGSNGLSSLIAIVDEAAGAHCAYGGKKVSSGLDTDANQVLGAGEVTSTEYVCNGAAGAGGLAWVNVTGASQAMASGTGYVTSSASQVTLTLPASPAIGDMVAVTGAGFGGWKIAQNAGQFITARTLGNDMAAGAVWRASGPNTGWTRATSSSSGHRLAAVAWGGLIHTSDDAGATWTAHESSRSWLGIASSADGSKLVAVAWGDQIYTSTDSGASWTPRDSARTWWSVASSQDGSKLVAVVNGGQIYTSTDSGASWTARDSVRVWDAVASSADGSQLVAVAYGDQIYTSADSGVTWTARDASRGWQAVASSADGNKLVAVGSSTQIYTSTDAGLNWTPRESARDWRAVASSADGSQLVAAVQGGQIYVSTDSGVTWTPRESARNWAALASSADGSRLAAFDGNAGQPYTSVAGRSTVGTAGSVSGSQYDALTLQYVGGGEFVAVQHALTGSLHME
jgi:photosystem II stability/assembly factor-like uncharacterized protein